MEQEQRYLNALASSATYAQLGNTLVLHDASGESLVVFGAPSAAE
jgi:heat shock protein HslJ